MILRSSKQEKIKQNEELEENSGVYVKLSYLVELVTTAITS